MPPTDEQLLVLNSILYTDSIKIDDAGNISQSVYDWALHYTPQGNGGEMSPEDQQHLVDEILAHPDVYQNIVPVMVENTPASVDPDGGQVTNVAFSYKGSDADAAAMIVVYKGTGGPMEWRDNGVGGYYDTTDTPQQQAALDFFNQATAGYQGDIYVTGHSKGGNKAQYVAVVADDPRIQSVTSFDGQGFNAAFLHKYAAQIARNQYKITSVANQLDYVNGLFAQIAGQTVYIESATTSPAGFRQWHSPYSMFQENLDGTVSLGAQAPQAAAIKQVEGLLDFYQAYMPKEDFQYLCFALMSFMMGDEAGDYGQQFEMPPGFVARLIALTHNWLNLSGADPADLAAPLSWILPPHLALPLGAALTGPLAVVYNRLPATGYQTIPRDFTEETKAMLLYLVYEVHDEPWWEVTRWDVWYRVEKFFGGVDFVGHGQGLMDYYRKIIDMQDVTAVRVNEIFQQVGEADRQYAAHLNAQADAIETLTALTRDLANTFLAPPAQPPRPPTPIAPDKPPE